MIGIGLTMEGINQNNIIYEFMQENGWRSQPRNVDRWFVLVHFNFYIYRSLPTFPSVP